MCKICINLLVLIIAGFKAEEREGCGTVITSIVMATATRCIYLCLNSEGCVKTAFSLSEKICHLLNHQVQWGDKMCFNPASNITIHSKIPF